MTGAHLQITNLRWRTGGRDILQGVDLDIAPGQRHAIAGHNGAGKTSLFNIIAGTIKPTSGRILLDGRDITGWPAPRIARAGVARTWQHPALCENFTVEDNIALAARPRMSRDGLHRLTQRLGLAAQVKTRAGELSYGDRKRTELSVALASQPRLLLLDEPFAGLDGSERDSLAAYLKQIGPSTTILMTDHSGELINALASHITILQHGNVVASRPHHQIRTRYQPMPQAQTRKGARPATASVVPLLQVRNLTVHKGQTPVLNDISFGLHAGEIVSLTGNSGTGKTTLLHAIAGLTPVSHQASITLAGKSIHQLPTHKRAQAGVVLVVQDRGIFPHLTAAANMRTAHTPRHTAAPDQLAVAQYTNRNAATLSGGQQQILAIARALQLQPKVMLLDEPFEGLDSGARAQLNDILARLAGQGTAILIAGQENSPKTPYTRRVRLSSGALHTIS